MIVKESKIKQRHQPGFVKVYVATGGGEDNQQEGRWRATGKMTRRFLGSFYGPMKYLASVRTSDGESAF